MVLYNLILFFFLKERTYLYYVLYVLSGALLFLSEDGLGFQYLWPGWPGLNHFIGAAAPVLLLLTFATYASGFLDTASRLPALHRVGALGGRLSTALLVLDAAVVHSGFSFWLYLLPYGLLYYAALRAYRSGVAAGALPAAGPGAGGRQPDLPHHAQAGHRFIQQRLHRVQPECGVCAGGGDSELRAGRKAKGPDGHDPAHAAPPAEAAAQKAPGPGPAGGADARKPGS